MDKNTNVEVYNLKIIKYTRTARSVYLLKTFKGIFVQKQLQNSFSPLPIYMFITERRIFRIKAQLYNQKPYNDTQLQCMSNLGLNMSRICKNNDVCFGGVMSCNFVTLGLRFQALNLERNHDKTRVYALNNFYSMD